MAAFDALLLVSFGGPEGPDDVVPFLENVTRGRGIPAERLKVVGQHYFRFGGVSPINQLNRALLKALTQSLPTQGIDLPVYWGNRNWTPYLTDTVTAMAKDGVQNALAVFTSAYSSYSGCRQYRENLAAARAAVGDAAPVIERVGPYFNAGGFVEPFIDSTLVALAQLPSAQQDQARLVFSTHSIPITMVESSGVPGGAYVRQHRDVAALVAAGVATATGVDRAWDLVFQSRSGPAHVPWLEPDINDHLTALKAGGETAVVVVPIGFVSDHMEVIWDLDTEAAQRADDLGLAFARAATPGTDPRFVSMIGQLVAERIDEVSVDQRPRLGTLDPSPDRCRAGCCPNPRQLLPAIGGSD